MISKLHFRSSLFLSPNTTIAEDRYPLRNHFRCLAAFAMHIVELLCNLFALDGGLFWAVFLPVLMVTQVAMSTWLIGFVLFRK